MRRVLAGLVAVAAWAQQGPVPPHIGYAYPAGGRQGSTFEMVLGGQNLAGAFAVYLSGAGVQAAVKRYERPLTPVQANALREQMQALNAKRTAGGKLTAAEQSTLAEIRGKLMDFQRRPTSPAIAETVVLEMTIGPGAESGARELRVGTSAGLTNPIAVQVGTLPEYTRAISKVPPEFRAVNGATPQTRPAPQAAATAMEIGLPATLNGQMMPATVDRYRFHARRGQCLEAAASARELIPYLSDAVPGWFQAALTLRDSGGREVAYADHDSFRPDPVVQYEVREDGDYTLEIHDSLYRGREDFVYRIRVAEMPATAAGMPRSKGGALRREKAQRVKLPAILSGSVAKPGERQFFRFEGKAGEEIAAEVTARRMDSPLDSVLVLSDAAGRQLAANDDFEDKGAGLLTHQADSRLLYRLPAKGTYYLELSDAGQHGGPEYVYRLRIGRPEPDFALRVTPSSVNVRGGATVPVTVYALRHDGFAGEIALNLAGAPEGFVLSGSGIPAGRDRIRLTLTAPPGPLAGPVALRLEGCASIGGREVRHTAVAAEDMMQAFAYHHLVAQSAWMVQVVGAGVGAARAAVRPVSQRPVQLAAGGTAEMAVAVAPRLAGQVQLELSEPGEGIRIAGVRAAGAGLAVTLQADAEKAKPGWKDNLILEVYVERPDAKQAARRRQFWGALPAVPVEVTR